MIHLVDHGGHDAIGINLKFDHLIPEVHGGDPLDRFAVAPADYLIALVHLFSLLSLDGYIIQENPGSVNTFLKKFFGSDLFLGATDSTPFGAPPGEPGARIKANQNLIPLLGDDIAESAVGIEIPRVFHLPLMVILYTKIRRNGM